MEWKVCYYKKAFQQVRYIQICQGRKTKEQSEINLEREREKKKKRV